MSFPKAKVFSFAPKSVVHNFSHSNLLCSSAYQLCMFTFFPADKPHLCMRVTSLAQPLAVPAQHSNSGK